MHVRVPASPPKAAWHLSLYPEAGEAGGGYQAPHAAPRVYVPGQPAADPVRARAEAARRARGKLRRYCTGNRLDRFATLTYGGERTKDPAVLRQHLSQFFRNLRALEGGDPFPYVWVPEWHKDGHLHAHFCVGRYIHYTRIRAAWGHGGIYIERKPMPIGSTQRDQARRAAAYLAKYVSKTFDQPGLFGRHRYDVAQGFQPAVTKLVGRSSDDVLAQASAVMGAAPARKWSSDEVAEWDRPPSVWFVWS